MDHQNRTTRYNSLPQRQQAYSQLPPPPQRQQHVRHLPKKDTLWQPRTNVPQTTSFMDAIFTPFTTPDSRDIE